MKNISDKIKEAAKIIDEKCSCGHLKSEHGANVHTIASDVQIHVAGHGPCSKCLSCDQFTWTGFIYQK